MTPKNPIPTLDEHHIYRGPDGRVIPGVTSVLKEYMAIPMFPDHVLHIPSGKLIPKDTLDRAAEIGTAIHSGFRYLLEGGLDWDNLDEILTPPLLTLEYWIKENVAEVILVEQPLYSVQYDYAGTPDLLCRLRNSKKGHLCLLDLKTGLYGLSTGPQTSAYEWLARENYGLKGFIDRAVLYVSKDGKRLEFVPMTDKTDFGYFIHKLEAYRWEASHTKQ